jgi:hypothetical protein
VSVGFTRTGGSKIIAQAFNLKGAKIKKGIAAKEHSAAKPQPHLVVG